MAITLKRTKIIKTSKKKLTILSVSKGEDKENYVLKKEQEFFPFLLDFLLKLEFSRADLSLEYFFGINHEEDTTTPDEYFENPFDQEYLDINEFNEELQTIENDKFDIEIIFFSSKINLIIRKKTKNKLHLGNLISKYALFEKE